MECGQRPAAQVLAAPQPLRSRQWLLCGIHLYLATGRRWPVTDRWLVVFDPWADGCDLMVADRPIAAGVALQN